MEEIQVLPTACDVCGNETSNKVYQVKEMQLGLRELFHYQWCADCGCMQLIDIPENLGKYYPNDNYYSFNLPSVVRKKPDLLRKLKASYLIHGKNRLLGMLLSVGYKMPEYYEWIKNAGVQYNDSILDVGTGNGSLLFDLFKIGYTNLTGIDPFINKEHHYGHISVLKKTIFEIEGQFDFIMLHHAFEHMDNPLKVLSRLKNLLNPGKCILIRIPIMNMYGWKTYNTNWVGLDAPRHIFIHSLKSMQLLADKAGLELRKIEFDSGPYHLWASEQYQKDVAFMEPESYLVNKKTSLFSEARMAEFKKIAEQTNRDKQADQAAFYLYKP